MRFSPPGAPIEKSPVAARQYRTLVSFGTDVRENIAGAPGGVKMWEVDHGLMLAPFFGLANLAFTGVIASSRVLSASAQLAKFCLSGKRPRSISFMLELIPQEAGVRTQAASTSTVTMGSEGPGR